MKTLEQILETNPVFLNNFQDCTEQEVFAAFIEYGKEFDEKMFAGYKVLFASYGTDNYEGYAWLLLSKDGELYENSASHCSCYGLEDQFNPEPVVLKELQNRLENGSFGEDDYTGNTFKNELKEFLGI